MSKLTKGYGSGGMQAILGDIKTYYEGELAKKANTSDLGTAASRNATNQITAGSTALPEAGAVKSYVDNNIPSVSGKADKVTNATSGHLAGLDSNGNLTDSGVSPTEEVTVEGNPVTFDSPFEQDAKSVVVSVKPIQDLHGYDHPWVGGAGKNKCDWNVSPTANALSIALSPNTYTISAKSTLSAGNWYFRFKDVNDNYISSPSAVGLNGYTFAESGWIYGGSNSQIVTFTIPSDCKLLEVGKLNADGTIPAQIEVGSTATSWEPYSNICPISGIDEVEIEVSGENVWNAGDVLNKTQSFIVSKTIALGTYVISAYVTSTDTNADTSRVLFKYSDDPSGDNSPTIYFSRNQLEQHEIVLTKEVEAVYFYASADYLKSSGDVFSFADLKICKDAIHTTTIPLPSTLYGGTVDVTEGDADSRFGMVTENYIANIRGVSSGGLYWCDIDAGAIDSSESKSSMLPKKDGASAWRSSEDCYTIANDTNKIRLYFKSSTEANAKLELAGLQIAYELATPTTISFDPTDVELLEGTNVVTTNGEKVAVTYKAGILATLGDIDDLNDKVKTKLDKKDVAKVEGANASKPYAVGDYMLRSDGFYMVTQAIAQNAPITSNNTDKTSVGNELSNKVDTDDSRLSDARTPVAHTHNISDITGIPAWTKLGEVTGTSPDYANSSTFNLSALQNKDVLMIFSVDEGTLTAKQGIITLEYSAFEFGKILEDSVQEEDEITRLWKGFYGGAPRESVTTFEEFLRGLGYVYIATHSTTAEIGAKIYGAYDWTLEIYTK